MLAKVHHQVSWYWRSEMRAAGALPRAPGGVVSSRSWGHGGVVWSPGKVQAKVNVPGYQAWFEATDQVRVYQGHRRQLQYLQWRCPGAPWVLKSPQHLWTLESLFEVYPDARIIQTHRDPLKIVASLTSLCCMLRSLTSDAIDPHAIGADWGERLAAGLAHTMAVRDSGAVPAESAMRGFLDDNAQDKHGRHAYRLADAGLDEASERERFAFYQERHGVASERVD